MFGQHLTVVGSQTLGLVGERLAQHRAVGVVGLRLVQGEHVGDRSHLEFGLRVALDLVEQRPEVHAHGRVGVGGVDHGLEILAIHRVRHVDEGLERRPVAIGGQLDDGRIDVVLREGRTQRRLVEVVGRLGSGGFVGVVGAPRLVRFVGGRRVR